jgi:hypothetical protein
MLADRILPVLNLPRNDQLCAHSKLPNTLNPENFTYPSLLHHLAPLLTGLSMLLFSGSQQRGWLL